MCICVVYMCRMFLEVREFSFFRVEVIVRFEFFDFIVGIEIGFIRRILNVFNY